MSKKYNGQIQEFHFPKPLEKQSFGKFLHNSEDGTFFGRTPKSWGQLAIFYIIFYTILAGLFAVCLQILFSTISDTEPKWKLEESLIGTNPGLGFRPLSNETERGSVIQFDTKKPEEGRYWKEKLDEDLKPYNTTGGKNQRFCGFNQTYSPSTVCLVDIEKFGTCSPKYGYGYKFGRPCILLKLNKIYGWIPQYYDDVNDLPEDMPADLKEHIANTSLGQRQQVWVSCAGQHAVSKETMGEIKYMPNRGFASYYYPYLNQPGYLSPLIAVQFEKIALNQMVNVECRAWAKNIIYSGKNRDRQGSVVFQLFID